MLMTRLYDREESAEALTKAICEFSAHALTLPRITASRRRAPGTGPLRVGFLSPAFCSSPVYFFCIGAMKHLAKEIDIVILSRGHRRDWATREFATIARHWHDVSRLGAAELAKFIADQALDVLVDQGGWMDVVALKAISAKPAARIYKWVGGQSVTTGIRAFDGFISDAYQTPANHQRFYVEPLVLMPDGYVTYTAPPYMPSPIPAEKGRLSVGVIANPAKVSRAFLADLEVRMNNLSEHTGEVGKIRFIDRRYRHQALRTRLLKSLGGLANASARRRIGIEFIAPDSHLAYLSEVARLTAVIDTYPYSGGLTTVEALSLGVPCWTTSGDLFCERHSYAHCAYATDLASEMTVIPGTARQNLYDDASLRHQHRRLANGLLALFKSGNHSVI
jgi:predicted O-linked N-acetylglucosamine transferase (SPINDLY family)